MIISGIDQPHPHRPSPAEQLHHRRYPESSKVFFPNIEMRLNESVNQAGDSIDVHFIFRPDVSKEVVDRFLREMKTEVKAEILGTKGVSARCSDLKPGDFERATVTRDNIMSALTETFGESPTVENVVILVPANNSGIRATSVARMQNLADRADEFSDAIFGGSQNVAWYLSRERYEDKTDEAKPKPVFAGCDAHSFEQLERWLGKDVRDASNRKEVTWIKADPTFEGLQQTLIEPEYRVRIQPTRPDTKEPYKFIAKVRFSGTNDFPEEIEFNQNLASIIGSRSSGKSALLAYTAHAVDPDHTIKQQMAAVESDRRQDMGPAAGKTWDDVQDIQCEVVWGDSSASSGRIIYIPQNSLFAISSRPDDITAKIEPALYRLDPFFRTTRQTMLSNVAAANTAIRAAAEEWFRLNAELNTAKEELRELGDKKAITSTRSTIAKKIESLRRASSLTQEETATYQSVIDELNKNEKRRSEISGERAKISPYVSEADGGGYTAADSVAVSIQSSPPPASLPDALRLKVEAIVEEAQRSLVGRLKSEIAAHQAALDTEDAKLVAANKRINGDNANLIAKHKAYAEIDVEVVNHRKQERSLQLIEEKERHIKSLQEAQARQMTDLETGLSARDSAYRKLETEFDSKSRVTEDENMLFGLEYEFTDQALSALTQPFNVRDISEYIERARQVIDLGKVYSDPAKFMADLASGSQKLKAGNTPQHVAVSVLSAAPEVRFYAILDGDRIGGFKQSSMTPGKQALFALTLILDESDDKWPLLIDQPEDDLDSRSVYDTIVPYLIKKKSERQIIMVSHNANLVVGADSEQIIVANRHGDDSPNRGSRTFDYLTGSLEHSDPKALGSYAFDKGGIREHACTILDGGEIAFQKRRDKYNIR